MTSVLAAVRLPVCSVDGALSGLHPVEMAALVLRHLVDDGPVGGDAIDEVWVGCAEPVGAQGADMARAAVLTADLPARVTGVVVDAAECSGTLALHAAVAAIGSGQVSHAAVLGISNSSMVPPGASALSRTYGRPWSDGPAVRFEAGGGLLAPHRAAELAAEAAGFDRADQDLVVRRSLDRRVTHARHDGVVGVTARFRAGSAAIRGTTVTADVLRDLPDELGRLTAAFEPDGTVTAASFAPPADGCCGLLLGPSGGPSLGRVVATGRAAGDPRSPSEGATAAVNAALDRAGLTRSDIVRWEIVESSAAALLCICARLGLDPAVVNPWGGTLATGDSAAAEEIRLTVDCIGCLDAIHTAGPIVTLVSGPTAAAATVLRPGVRVLDQPGGS